MHVWKLASAFILLCVGSGCATVLRGDKQKVKFDTDPPIANLSVDGKDYKTPVEISLKRKEPHDVIVSLPGYQPIQFQLVAQWDGASLPNIAAPGGSAMFATDTATGADKSFYTLAVIKLAKMSAATTQPLVMYERRGKLMTKVEYDKALVEERKAMDEANRE
jgi:hypothetical protein